MTRPTPKEEAVRGQPRDQDGGAAAGDSAAAAEPGVAAEPGGAAEPLAEAEPRPAGEPRADAEPRAEQPAPAPDPLTSAQAERDDYLELARRTQADFENFRKRTAKDLAAAGERAKLGLVRELLPVVDNLERALESAGDASGVADGVRLVLTELQGVLARNGVAPVDPTGDQFDPTVHEALSTRAADGTEPGLVLDVVEKGYRMGDTVVRPARVVVSA
jgi:molecular chaperone GrpE